MGELEQSRLLEEYRTNVELWKHDDNLRQQRTGNLSTINAILISGLGLMAGFNPPALVLLSAALSISLVGGWICLIWRAVQIRNAAYVSFRRFQLRSIESQLPGLTTFQNTYKGLDLGESVTFGGTGESWRIEKRALGRSTLTEGLLPLVIGVFWLFALLMATAAFIALAVIDSSILVHPIA